MSVEEYRKAAVDAVQKLSVESTKLEALKEEDLQFLWSLLMLMLVHLVTRKIRRGSEGTLRKTLCKLISGTRAKMLKCDKV